jgi:hypothetical protein
MNSISIGWSVLSYLVIAGLDPAIHATSRIIGLDRICGGSTVRFFSMDRRVKPGGDEKKLLRRGTAAHMRQQQGSDKRSRRS